MFQKMRKRQPQLLVNLKSLNGRGRGKGLLGRGRDSLLQQPRRDHLLLIELGRNFVRHRKFRNYSYFVLIFIITKVMN